MKTSNFLFIAALFPLIVHGATPTITAPKPIKSEPAVITGKVSQYQNIGMTWYELQPKNGKRVGIGALGNLDKKVQSCLDDALDHEHEVTISGTRLMWKDKSESFEEPTVKCQKK